MCDGIEISVGICLGRAGLGPMVGLFLAFCGDLQKTDFPNGCTRLHNCFSFSFSILIFVYPLIFCFW